MKRKVSILQKLINTAHYCALLVLLPIAVWAYLQSTKRRDEERLKHWKKFSDKNTEILGKKER